MCDLSKLGGVVVEGLLTAITVAVGLALLFVLTCYIVASINCFAARTVWLLDGGLGWHGVLLVPVDFALLFGYSLLLSSINEECPPIEYAATPRGWKIGMVLAHMGGLLNILLFPAFLERPVNFHFEFWDYVWFGVGTVIWALQLSFIHFRSR